MNITKNKSFLFKVFLLLIVLFIVKNITLFTLNNIEIRKLQVQLLEEKTMNLEIVDEVKNIKTDAFVIRYAVANLNLRPADKDLVDLSMSEKDLLEVKARIEAGIFGKKFENIPTPKIDSLDKDKSFKNDFDKKILNN